MDRTHVARELTRITHELRTGTPWDAVGEMETLIREQAPILTPIIQPRGDYGYLSEMEAIIRLARESNAIAPNLETAISLVYYEARHAEAMIVICG